MTRSLLLLAAASGILTFATLACSGDPGGSGKSAMCNPDTEDCAPSAPTKKSGSSSNNAPATSENDVTQTQQPTEPAPASPAADAGVDAAPAADASKTTFCQDLATCCGELKAQGYDDSACKAVVAKNVQTTCLQKLASYQSFGDCSQAH